MGRKANNFEVSFSALRKDIETFLDFTERLKDNEDQKAIDMADQIEDLKYELAFICTYAQLSYSDLDQFENRMSGSRQEVENLLRQIFDDVGKNVKCKYDMHHFLSSRMDNIDDCINLCHRSKSSVTMTVEKLDFLLLNLHHLSKYCAEQLYPSVTEYEILQNVCGNVKEFHGFIMNGCIKNEIAKDVISLFRFMAERVGNFMWDELYSEDSQVINLASLLLKIIIPVQLEVMHTCVTNLKASTSAEVGRFIKHLVETSPDILSEYLIRLEEKMVTVLTPSTPGARNIHVMVEFLLIILTDMPMDFIHRDKLFDLLAHVGALTWKVSTFVRCFRNKSAKEESTNETNCTSVDFLKDIELLKGDLGHEYLKAPDSFQICFPMSDGQLFMHLLLMHLNDLLDSNAYSVSLIKEEIELVKEDLEFIRLFFVNAGQVLYKDIWKRVLDVAYEAKDVIDSIIVRDNGLLHLIFSLPRTIKNIKLIKEEVSNLHENIPKNRGLNVVNSPNKLVENKSSPACKIIVGFEEETDWIIEKLIRGTGNLDVISITGMPGLGKTTLAYKVYNNESVSRHFDTRAWCTVGQEYNKKKLLEKIFKQVTGSDPKFSENFDMVDELRKQLFVNRYLIVLDDLWDIDSWDELTRPFPDVEKKGSRIILTTRLKEVALHGKCHCDPLDLRLLKPEESWELLEKRVFGKESCPDELLDVGKKIAENCKGLPLVANLIAGVIADLEKKKTVWVGVLNNLSSFILNSEEDQVMKVIGLSYDHLPVHLKPCLLRIACRPKDGTDIPVSGLKMICCAEGLVEQTDMEVYLDKLISSSLVILLNEIGDEPTCRLHDLVYDFCLEKAKEEKFFDWISSSAPSSSSSDLMPRIVHIKYDKEHFGLNNFVLFDSKKKRHYGKHLYSLGVFGDELDDHLSDTCQLRHLRLLRVLSLDSSFIMVNESLLNEICMLNHLRLLNIETEVVSLPLSFSNLWNLETLVVGNEGCILVLLPRIFDLVKLRSLSVSACSFFGMYTDEPILIAEDSKLESLRFLDTVQLSYSKAAEDIFKRFPNLQELTFYLGQSWDYSEEQYWFPKLDFLTELEHLRVKFEGDPSASEATNRSWDFHFPSNLKKLWLSYFPLTSDSLSTIARLPNLEELCLIRTFIHGEEWNMGEEDTFEKLKYLYLGGVTVAKWEVGEESFPMLEKLELCECHKLKDIPASFGDIYSLKVIKLVQSSHLEDSAKSIKEYVEDITGEDRLQLLGWNDIPLFK